MIGRPASLRLYNKRTIVRALLRIAPASRADLAKSVGMSQVTAGKIVEELLAEGIVEEREVPLDRNRLGRPGRMLQLGTSRSHLLAIQLGTTHTRLACVPVGLHRQDHWPICFPTPDNSAAWRTQLTDAVRQQDMAGVLGVLISIPGVIDERSGQILLAPNLHWLEGANLTDLVRSITGKPVTLLQEQRALAYGQLAVEPVSETMPRDFLIVDFGEGLGAAAAVNGKVYVGPLALNGELGHTPVVGNLRPCGCGAVGCVETLVHRAGLLQSFREATGNRRATWEELVSEQTVAAGLPEWLGRSLEQVATAMAAAANIMGIQRVIITGSLTEFPPVVVEYLSQSVIKGCLWKRFGRMICHAGERHRLAGLIAAGIDRVLLPGGAWEP